MEDPDQDLASMSRDRLVDEVKLLRKAIRLHRDSAGHDLCWYHPEMWGMLPEKTVPKPTVPDSIPPIARPGDPRRPAFQEGISMKEISRHRSFRVMVQEWTAHLEGGGGPEGYAWWFENVMSEPRPLKGYPGLRKRCWAFARALTGRRWETVRQALPDLPAFRLPHAADFYKSFKRKLISDIRYYVKGLSQPRRPQFLSCQARMAVLHFGGLFAEKGQEKAPKRRRFGPGFNLPRP